ncbi:hypothetical protein [Gracilimonas mengyeensis]|uniref:Uncharacterized protein n=1 Tax=Gracilimonas mengyeensis TaxID=1302730 RepID=A0A521CNP5_9BACT|nr:hypothetical protein [Gracilimonas mengyeensis]SMO61005.1 hypothetical protein SAMN06265219_10627 [Gracilimonas mengyeensis]
MQKRSDFYFKYPPNIHELDLATMVHMFRSRGEPKKAPAGQYFACAVSGDLLKEAKWWFGLHYSQSTWDKMLTKGSEGFPITDVELNVLGLVYQSEDEPPHREYIEKKSGVTEKLAYLIVNDLRTFGFLDEDDSGFVRITPRGEKALHGIARRIYEKRFLPEMLRTFTPADEPTIEQAQKEDQEQTSLF